MVDRAPLPVTGAAPDPGVNHRMSEENGRLMRLATYASVVAACALIVIKLAVWILTGSVSILSSLLDSLLDAGAKVAFGSDWSVAPLAGSPASIWLRVIRKAEAVEVFYSLDGAAYTLLRIAYLRPSAKTSVGVMCAAPDGHGFEVSFDNLRVQPA